MRKVQRAPDTQERRERKPKGTMKRVGRQSRASAEPRVQTSLRKQLEGIEGLDPLRKVREGCFREVAGQYG